MQKLVATIVLAFGGSSISSILAGTSPPWLYSDTLVPGYAMVYAIMFHFPLDLPYLFLTSIPIFSTLITTTLTIFDAVRRSLSVTDLGVERYGNNMIVASLILGALCGVGGGAMLQMFGLDQRTWRFSAPAMFRNKTWDMRLAFSVAAFYMALTWDSPLRQPAWDMVHVGNGSLNSSIKTAHFGTETTLGTKVEKEAAKSLCIIVMVLGILTRQFWYWFSPRLGKQSNPDDSDSDDEKVVLAFNKGGLMLSPSAPSPDHVLSKSVSKSKKSSKTIGKPSGEASDKENAQYAQVASGSQPGSASSSPKRRHSKKTKGSPSMDHQILKARK